MTTGPRRTIARLTLAALAVGVFTIGYQRSIDRGNDFDNFYDAAVSVWQDGVLLREKGTARYLPSFQVLVSPLGALPLAAAASLWLLLNLASYAALVWIFASRFGVSPTTQLPAWLCVAPFVVGNLTLAQSGPLLLALAAAGIAATAHGRSRLAGAALTLAGLIKVLPAALLAIPLALGRAGATLAGAAATAAVVGLCVALVIGPGQGVDDSLRWLSEVRGEQTPARLVEVVRGLRYNNQGLAITLARTFGDFARYPAKAAPGSTQLLALPLAWVWAFYSALLAALGGAFAAIVWRVRGARRGPREYLGVFGLAVPPMLAASPIVWTHYFLWLLPGFVYLSDRRRALLALAAVSLAAIYWTPARGLGFHMALGLVQFVWIARRLWADTAEPIEAGRARAEPAPGPGGP